MNTDSLFNLSDDELAIAQTKSVDKNQLGFGVLLKYFQLEGHYPKHTKYIDPLMISCIANQLNILPSCIDNFDWEGRSTMRFRQEIRELLGYKRARLEDVDKLKAWLIKEIFPHAPKKSQQIEYVMIISVHAE